MKMISDIDGIVSGDHPGQGAIDVKNAGYDSAALNMCVVLTPKEIENIGKKRTSADKERRIYVQDDPHALSEAVRPVIRSLKDAGLEIPIALTPHLQEGTKQTTLNEYVTLLAEESIRICGEEKIPYLIVKPLFAGIAYGEEWEINKPYFLRLGRLAREKGVRLLLENQCKGVNGHMVRGILSDPAVARMWLEELNAQEDVFGFCLDVGVCNLNGQDMNEIIKVLGKRIEAVIIRGNDGHINNSLLPFTSTTTRGTDATGWIGLVRGLRELCYDGLIVFDMADTAAAFPPLLRPEILKVGRKVLEYFKWQIDLENMLKQYPAIVLFGAGNMCRNYLKNYGEKYPPLFTCDNNSKRWGTSLDGLMIRSPEELRNIPGNVCIMICNIYYRDIEKQLRDMGLQNPIEFFNDEYLPQISMNRVKGLV